MSILNQYQYLTLSSDQTNALSEIETFLKGGDSVFLLKGYAGTGKTTLLQGLCKYFDANHQDYVLMAPTGRAAMILNQKTKQKASTIHRQIYNRDEMLEDETTFKFYFGLYANENSTKCIYLVDEASMISDVYSDDEFFTFGSGQLLKDLFEFVFSGNKNSKIVFIGDEAQLPPVNMKVSPALNKKYLNENYNVLPLEYTLKDVIRQHNQSGVLAAATAIRQSLENNTYSAFNIKPDAKEVYKLEPAGFSDSYQKLAQEKGPSQVMVITHSNRQAFEYNQLIRTLRYGKSAIDRVQKTDVLLITKNNYNGPVEVFNGMFAKVKEVGRIVYQTSPRFKIEGGKVIQCELSFREVIVEIKNSDGVIREVKTTIIDNFIFTEEGRLHPYDQRALYVDFKERMRNKGIKPKTDAYVDALRNDMYFNALQAKFGYAITCHKSQGGEWDSVLIDFKVFMGQMTSSYFRWAYTAITRSKNQLYCIDAPQYDALSQFVVKDILPLNGIASNAYLVSPTEDPLGFVKARKDKLEQLCHYQDVSILIKEYSNQLDVSFNKGNDAAIVQLWYKKGGFSKHTWKSCNNKDFEQLILGIMKESLMPVFVPFEPRFDFQGDLHRYLGDIFNSLEVRITNIVQNEWSDVYYIQTDADCALLEFYFDKKDRYTFLQPKSTDAGSDQILLKIIDKLNGN